MLGRPTMKQILARIEAGEAQIERARGAARELAFASLTDLELRALFAGMGLDSESIGSTGLEHLTDRELEDLAGEAGKSDAADRLASLEARYRACSTVEEAKAIYLETWPDTKIFGCFDDLFRDLVSVPCQIRGGT